MSPAVEVVTADFEDARSARQSHRRQQAQLSSFDLEWATHD